MAIIMVDGIWRIIPAAVIVAVRVHPLIHGLIQRDLLELAQHIELILGRGAT